MIDHRGNVYLARNPDEAGAEQRDGHYSLQADESDRAHLRYGREHVPMRVLNPERVELEEPREEPFAEAA